MTYKPNTSALEDDEQISLVDYLETRGLKFTAVPNSTYSPHISVKVRNKKLGLRPGLPDIIVALPGIGIAFIELKRVKGGVVSDVQKAWIETLNACPGTEARVCKGCMAAIAFIEELSPSSYGKALLSDKSIF